MTFLNGFICGLLIAWVLTWFNVDDIIINGIFDLTGYLMTKSVYYLAFGVILGAEELLRGIPR
jgi:hypothetical protein